MFDLADKLEQVDNRLARNERGVHEMGLGGGDGSSSKRGQDKLSKAIKDSSKLTCEVLHGLMAQMLKNALFNEHGTGASAATNTTSVAVIHGMMDV